MRAEDMLIFDAAAVRAKLDYPNCIRVVREGMAALSAGTTRQLLRTMIGMGPGRTFAQMPGALGDEDMFGAKMISVFADPATPDRRRHRGLVVMFEPEQGRPVCIADAEEITLIRTAAASAVATDLMAREDAKTLLILGTGGQARTHLRALPLVRKFDRVLIWGRDAVKAEYLAQEFDATLPVEVATDVEAAAGTADVICTLTGAAQPVLLGEWVRPGAHINIVGSSFAGPVEIDTALVTRSRYIADSRASALEAAAEFLIARASGAINDTHLVGEIGEVVLGRLPGRTSPDEVTAYKSLGHAVQDLAAAAFLYRSSLTR